ncbi:hypothetical protein ACTWPF_01565 [Oceanobacillus sp. M65]|uniref:hypothetical protein n=1 Tax=Oceanobacillus sp. M65 TaxID=3457435 RepID=UPI003FCD361E
MSTDVIPIVSIISIVIWVAVTRELLNPKKEIRKIITLMYAGCLSTLILTISLFQHIQA